MHSYTSADHAAQSRDVVAIYDIYLLCSYPKLMLMIGTKGTLQPSFLKLDDSLNP